MEKNVSIIIPAKNEEEGLSILLPELIKLYPGMEIIVVNDGSTDGTLELCQKFKVKTVSHPYSMGNGAAVKSGARSAAGDVFVFMDADGQHRAKDIAPLLERLSHSFDMVVGARDGDSQASVSRGLGNHIYNKLASYMTGKKIKDLTSGFRAVRAEKFKEFLYLLPNGFSYPTTITMSFFRAGYLVDYYPITMPERIGSSHLNLVRDGVRFFLIIFKVGTLYSPLKIFTPVSLFIFILGLVYYIYTFVTDGRFTNMGVLLFTTSIIIFLMGLVSEQITALMYKTDTTLVPDARIK